MSLPFVLSYFHADLVHLRPSLTPINPMTGRKIHNESLRLFYLRKEVIYRSTDLISHLHLATTCLFIVGGYNFHQITDLRPTSFLDQLQKEFKCISLEHRFCGSPFA